MIFATIAVVAKISRPEIALMKLPVVFFGHWQMNQFEVHSTFAFATWQKNHF